MKALIFDGKITQIEGREFPVAPPLVWVDLAGVSPVPSVGWSYDGTVFTAPPPASPLPPRSAAPLTAEEIATELVRKGLLLRSEFDAVKTSR